jgi:hypothetical protein
MVAQSGVVNIRGKDYKTVALRVSEFREKHPIEQGWAILTEIVDRTDTDVVMKATIVNPDDKVLGVGFAEENRKSSQINSTSALENCETSAIGRALANIGLGGSEYASANEVENAIHQQRPNGTGGADFKNTRKRKPEPESGQTNDTVDSKLIAQKKMAEKGWNLVYSANDDKARCEAVEKIEKHLAAGNISETDARAMLAHLKHAADMDAEQKKFLETGELG